MTSKAEIQAAKDLAKTEKLRDKFAAAALAGLLANKQNSESYKNDLARKAYAYASAMLEIKTEITL